MTGPIAPGATGGPLATAMAWATDSTEETWADRAGLQGEFAWALDQLMAQQQTPMLQQQPQPPVAAQASAPPEARGAIPEPASRTRATQQAQLREAAWPLPPSGTPPGQAWQLSLPAPAGAAGGLWSMQLTPGARQAWALQLSSPQAVAPLVASLVAVHTAPLAARLQAVGAALESLAVRATGDAADAPVSWRERRGRS